MRLRSESGRTVVGVSLFCAFVMACGTTVLGVPLPATAEPADRAEAAARASVRLLDLSSRRRQFNVLARQRPSMPEGERVGAWADFTTMAAAVIGEARIAPLTFDDLAATAASADEPRVAVTSGLGSRDEAAYQLLALGYSARETADVVSGRISVQALDNARRMIAGLGREEAANYLDTQYRLVRASREPAATNPAVTRVARRLDVRTRWTSGSFLTYAYKSLPERCPVRLRAGPPVPSAAHSPKA